MNGSLQTIVFLRMMIPSAARLQASENPPQISKKDKEASGYIDLAQRLKTEDFEQYFRGGKIFQPKPGDLSYLDWTALTLKTSSQREFPSHFGYRSWSLVQKQKRSKDHRRFTSRTISHSNWYYKVEIELTRNQKS